MNSLILRCENLSCNFRVRLVQDVPEWKPDTPPNLAKVPVGQANEQYVARYTSERYCAGCGQVVEMMENDTKCPRCGEIGSFLESGDQCSKCGGMIKSSKGAVF